MAPASEAAFPVQLLPASTSRWASHVLALVSCPSRARLAAQWEQLDSLSGQGPFSGIVAHPLGHRHASPALLELIRHFTRFRSLRLELCMNNTWEGRWRCGCWAMEVRAGPVISFFPHCQGLNLSPGTPPLPVPHSQALGIRCGTPAHSQPG